MHYMERDLAAAGVPTGCMKGNRHVVELSKKPTPTSGSSRTQLPEP
jgi:hypothetical protein